MLQCADRCHRDVAPVCSPPWLGCRYKVEFDAAVATISESLARDWDGVLKAEVSWETRVERLEKMCAK